MVRLVAIILLGVALAVAKRSEPKDEGTERMLAEIDAGGDATAVQSAEMATREAVAVSNLDDEYADALKDIMAVITHGSDTSKDSALERLVELAVTTGEASRDLARNFRSAVVAGGALPAVVEMLGAAEPRRAYVAAAALHALALDDPETDEDNFHQGEICQAGAIPLLVKLLDADEMQLQMAVTAALGTLAENPTCQAMIAAEGAIAPLVNMAHYGSDMQKLGALGALDVLSVNNPSVRAQLTQEGAPQILDGLASMGSGLLRDEAKAFGARMAEKAPSAPMSVEAHRKTARQTRMRYDSVRQRAFQRMQGWSELPEAPPEVG